MLLNTYKGVIESLIPVYDRDDFTDTFDMMTQGEDGPTRLQIKMELHRLMAPCHQIVDLRGRVNGDCRPYELHGLRHWLDDVALNTYHQGIKAFSGQFRVGLYEALTNTHNNFRVMHQQEKQQQQALQQADDTPMLSRDTQHDVPLLRFGHYLTRHENRLHISTPVNLELPDGHVVNAITADLSFSGAKFKVPSAFAYHLGMIVHARFPNMADVLNTPHLMQGLAYRVLAIDESHEHDSYKWLRLKIVGDSSVIKSAIEDYLDRTQNRARQDHEDKVIQVRTRGYEHCYLKHSSAMPLFFSGTTLKYSLLTPHNRHVWDDWHDERNQPVINQLLSEARLTSLGKAGLKQSSTLLYSFSHCHNGNTYFYSAALPEMNREQRQLFWHVGAQRASWRVYRLTLQPISQDNLDALKDIAPEMIGPLSALTHVGLLQDLSNCEAQHDYRLIFKPKMPASALHPFRHLRDPVASAKAVYFDPKPQRCEDRFLFQTPVHIHTEDGVNLPGKSVDFSSRGLNIALSSPLSLKRHDTITISFPRLQQMDKRAPLEQIPYRVVRISPDYRQIQLITGKGARAEKCEQFLRKLIQHNENKLTRSGESLPRGELLLAMHQMLLGRLNSVPYFAEKNAHKVTIKAIGCNFPVPPLVKLFHQIGEQEGYSLEPIFRDRHKRMLTAPLRPAEIQQPYVHEVYVWVEREGDTVQHVEGRLYDDFADTNARIQFIKQARYHGEFIALRITAVPVLSPMTTLIRRELGELARLTLHRARALEEELSTLMGCGELHDITDEVLIRLEIT
ncbi:PilZ domain-containing protein [Photobacterium japonica]|uniref:PilZ domain-containing protein n=1 Tax=Photobacterium japonica TaxID=2910235 RepID=UPI003D0BFEBC